MPTEMEDRVARAMAAYVATLPKTSDDAPFIYKHRIELARAAIAAMREPTDAMVTKVAKGMRNVRYLQDETRETITIDAWKAMIDTALRD